MVVLALMYSPPDGWLVNDGRVALTATAGLLFAAVQCGELSPTMLVSYSTKTKEQGQVTGQYGMMEEEQQEKRTKKALGNWPEEVAKRRHLLYAMRACSATR